ncbi:type I-F CRISPR-associated protein Csy1 [Pseudomonas aeruginosa]|nr:type I-F CRISPR-associated protein Csy1 [Pseudomonas aeruginosa]
MIPPTLRQLIESFIQERLQGKLDKLKPDEDVKRQSLLAGHRREAWLADAARRVGQLQLVTHTLKPIHPDARGSNLHSLPQAPGQPGLAGSHERQVTSWSAMWWAMPRRWTYSSFSVSSIRVKIF